jgi:ABC-type nitrate/sulfonate/bicarbonate transport system permease component
MDFFNPHHPLTSSQKNTLLVSAFIVMLTIWSALTGFDLISPNKLPSPLAVMKAFSYLAWDNGNSMLLVSTFASLTRILTAAFFVVVVGVPVGIMMGASPKTNAFLSPLIDPFRSAPVVALLPLFVMWLGIGEEMKVAFLVTSAIVFIIPMVRDAIVSVPYYYWEGTRDLGATHWECITKCLVPIAAPRIFDAIIVSTSILWTYITVAEYVNADSGLGQLIQNARRFSAMDQVFVGVITIIALALITYSGLSYIKRTVYHWEGKQ